jgi:hypothetical protein
MRAFGASLIALSVLYFWDKDYNGSQLLDGLQRMIGSISHDIPTRLPDGVSLWRPTFLHRPV